MSTLACYSVLLLYPVEICKCRIALGKLSILEVHFRRKEIVTRNCNHAGWSSQHAHFVYLPGLFTHSVLNDQFFCCFPNSTLSLMCLKVTSPAGTQSPKAYSSGQLLKSGLCYIKPGGFGWRKMHGELE